MGQARVDKPLRDLVGHLNGAKRALGELFQAAEGQKASDQAQQMLDDVDRVLKRLYAANELMKDPWTYGRRR